ncbi:amino acid adenylation domain-containing protein [Rhodococcus sp. Z13]|uniref:Amino acid adenylation domain-containing protein n=1 Tax=Rhodococcus sacchari TaxID=2962047 RepID=A0ACD4DDJ7_9NOCA|nr:amino acid adenylation domain-containing protein [Rhodococcus sp. Z13]UYP18025.1 amino acid adenylation domain-containing protein [Rhodococcus sp. Z13]
MPAVHTDLVPTEEPAPTVSVADLFEVRARASADLVAVTAGERSVTYGELDELSNRWARRLIAAGAAPGRTVAVALPRDISLVVLVVAVAKTGAAYLPLDTTHPPERLVRILEDAEPDLLIVESAQFQVEATRSLPPVLEIEDEDPANWSAVPITDADRRGPVHRDDTAYVVYTSGSTGTPKGVAVSHRNVTSLFVRTLPLFEFGGTDVWTLFHSCAFDFAVWEMWGALVHGARLVVVDHPTSRDPEKFRALVAAEGVTVLNLTPSAFYQFVEADRTASEGAGESTLALRHVILGGEALKLVHLAPWFSRYGDETPCVTNMYGITETTVHTSFQRITADLALQGVPSLIGRPLPDVGIHVLDDRLNPVPMGQAGEVYVTGDQVAQGYVNRSALTATRFVADPYSSTGTVMYRTGDVARWDEQERLVYLGRSDAQVQVRGFRIELEEVEAALLGCEPVVNAAAAVRTDDRFGDRLVGYIVVREGESVDPAAARTRLAAFLPPYMVPDAVVLLERLPLTVNGKLDRAALPAPVFVSTKPYRAPRTETERCVATVFADVLDVERIGLDDGFFELGGNSLLAAAAVAMLRDSLGQDVDLRWVMATPTPAGLASRIDAAASETFRSGATASGLEVLFPLRAGEGPGVFIVHPLMGLAWSYIGLALALDFPGPVVGLQTPALTDDGPLPESIGELAARYVAEIRSIQPEGPFHLVGWSLGGVIAHCMATTLQESGAEVGSLVLMDALLDSKLENFYDALVQAFAPMGVHLTADEAVDGLSTENAQRIADLVSANVGPITPEQVRRVFSMAVDSPEQVNNHSPATFRGDLLFLAAEKEREDPNEVVDPWREVVDGTIVVRMIPSVHNDMVSEESVAVIAPVLDDWLKGCRR